MITINEILLKAKEAVTEAVVESTKEIKHIIEKSSKEENPQRIIENLGFIVNRTETPKNDEFQAKQLYYCQYKDWIFPIREIENGPLMLNDPRNIKTGEKILYYCDINCIETSKERLENIVKAMDMGIENFINSNYGHLLDLPYLLKANGYDVKEEKFMFSIYGYEACLNIDKQTYIRIYKDKNDEMKFVVTNNRNWNSDSHIGYWGDKAYYFEYNDRSDLIELCKCIDAFNREMRGDYGYLEDGYYYKNEYLDDMIEKFRRHLKINYQTDLQNGKGIIEDENQREEEKKKINHYKGIDIFKEFEIKFKNETMNNEIYKVTFQYDRKRDEKHCILIIDSKIYRNEDYVISNDACELKGSFKTLSNKLIDFIEELYEIHEMKLY